MPFCYFLVLRSFHESMCNIVISLNNIKIVLNLNQYKYTAFTTPQTDIYILIIFTDIYAISVHLCLSTQSILQTGY